MLIRTIAFVCDKCLSTTVAVNKTSEALDLPPNWKAEYSFYSSKEIHICDKCIEKKEIQETFK